jgi:hypothetical protein
MSQGKAREFERVLRMAKRRLILSILRPRPLRHPRPFNGPVLIVGSAPVSNLPKGFDGRFAVITINGSQAVTTGWGLGPPDVTLMQLNQIEGTTDNARAVRRVLQGQRTRLLYVMRWKNGMARLESGLAAFDYRYDDLQIVSRYRRMALFEAVLGRRNIEVDNETKFSNGVTGVLYAAASGASAIIITGIDPTSKGHVYNELGLPRLHATTDWELLQEIRAGGFPLYTADPHVATSLDLPLWDGEYRE